MLDMLVANSNIYFSGQDVGETIECTNPRQSCRLAAREKYRCRLGDLVDSETLDNHEKDALYNSEPGL